MNGTDLLADFREKRSEEAFRELVLRYTNLVYCVAKRRVSNASLAEEITQIVFIRLAKAAPKLAGDAELAAWLHRTTVHASIDLWRSESRRRAREQYAVAMQTDPNETVPWNDLAPVLDDAVNDLNDADREAVVLRFFHDKSMRDVGATLGVSEDAAKMRVSRALDRLRNLVSTRGVSCGAVAFATLLAERSVEAAPAHVAANLAALKIPAPATAGVSMAIVAGVASLMLVGAGVWFFRPANQPTTPALESIAAMQSSPTTSAAVVTQETIDAAAASNDPDPLQLLHAVARARERIISGTMEFYGFTENTVWGPRATNHLRLAAVFDGPKVRFESIGREYSYVGIGAAGEASAAKMKELGLDNEGAVQAGLLTPSESHHVVAYDGSVIMDYWENDKRPNGTTIRDLTNGTSAISFDPRILGLTHHPTLGGTVEGCLGYKDAKFISLVGKELAGDTLAWHVNVHNKYGSSLHFWLDLDRPTRVVKYAYGSDVVISKYDGSGPIPVEVTSTAPKSSRRITQTSAQFNVPVESTSFTLAGLGMQVGTPVTDLRNSRGIGYWTGSDLEQLPSGKAKITESPKLAELMALLENNPTSHFALEAAIWIILNTPDGPEVEKAAEVILQEHIESPELLTLCKEQDRVRHRSSKKLLQALLAKNPNANIKGVACFNLATLAKEQAQHGLNKAATAEADKLFDRVLREFSKSDFAHRAKIELDELRRMAIGNPAPPIEGVDLDGQPMSLSDYRGKVVVVHFWGQHYDEPEEHHKLVAAMAGKPFALIGVNDDEKPATAKATLEKHRITWPSFWDGVYWKGPIHSNWHVRKWPSIYVLDQNGVIRYRDLRGHQKLEEAVTNLLHLSHSTSISP